MNEEKETLIPVSVEELAALEAMAMLSDCRVIDFRTISDRIDERAGDDSKGPHWLDVTGLCDF